MCKHTRLFIVGVQKCGTGTLYNVLRQHSNINDSKIKEPQFFGLPYDVVRDNIEWYEDLFGGGRVNKARRIHVLFLK
ncbi:sulfotransferase domain-containing protein [Salinibacter ruber]|uniref:sulfotransferase domain-containing protein n=1 Tax=Salinibacter ruber TaxID=146919 RepID=UPI003C6E5630